MRDDRVLPWDGCCNVRDLGGLETQDGVRTTFRSLIRAENVERLTADGWAALVAYGVRTVVDLRNDDELGADAAARPGTVTTVRVPIDDVADTQMWDFFEAEGYGGLGPLYYPRVHAPQARALCRRDLRDRTGRAGRGAVPLRGRA